MFKIEQMPHRNLSSSCQEANKKIIEQLEQLVEAVEFSAETLEVKMNSHSAKERKMIFTAGLTLKKRDAPENPE